MDLPLDVKFKIASFDMDTWIRLSYMDDEFKTFSYGIGRKLFIDLFTIIHENKNCKKWTIFGKLHRFDDQPAIIFAKGDQIWYQNDLIHRDNNQPAIIYANGEQQWYQNGKRHRDGSEGQQPAVIWSDGSQFWYQNGETHRDNDQPAIIYAAGYQR